MFLSIRQGTWRSKIPVRMKIGRPYSSASSASGGSGKVAFGAFATIGAGFAGAVVYGKYDPKFRSLLENNIPYVDMVYKLFPNEELKPSISAKIPSEDKMKDPEIPSGFLKNKLKSGRDAIEVTHDAQHCIEESTLVPGSANERLLYNEMKKLQKISEDTVAAINIAVEAIKEHSKVSHESFDPPQVVHSEENFQKDLRLQLRRQAAVHADHIQEVLKLQKEELDRRFSIQLQEQCLRQKGVIMLELSMSFARLKGILNYLTDKSEFDIASHQAQALWLSCQAMLHTTSSYSNPRPLERDISNVRRFAADSDLVTEILGSIPKEATCRGIYTGEDLKQRFQVVERVCRQVALVDENNNSLYRYLLSYLQSFLVVSGEFKHGLSEEIVVDWDTFSILDRVSHCLKTDDLEQALRYANRLKGEPKVVAKDWIKEMRLLLETQLAVKALVAHAAAVAVQACH